jgi:hypothetical protein
MATKVTDISKLKQDLNTAPEVVDVESTPVQGLGVDMLLPARRQDVVTRMDKMLSDSGLSFYEGLLGFTDLFNSVFVGTLNENVLKEEERSASDERINGLRGVITKSLNERTTNFIAEDMIVLLSLMAEAVMISVAEDANRSDKAGEEA